MKALSYVPSHGCSLRHRNRESLNATQARRRFERLLEEDMARSTNPRRFLSEAETAGVQAAIKEAEQRTSVEVKVVL